MIALCKLWPGKAGKSLLIGHKNLTELRMCRAKWRSRLPGGSLLFCWVMAKYTQCSLAEWLELCYERLWLIDHQSCWCCLQRCVAWFCCIYSCVRSFVTDKMLLCCELWPRVPVASCSIMTPSSSTTNAARLGSVLLQSDLGDRALLSRGNRDASHPLPSHTSTVSHTPTHPSPYVSSTLD